MYVKLRDWILLSSDIMLGTGRIFGMQRRKTKWMNRAVRKPEEKREYERRAGIGG
jgi:hypothetical protein